MSIKILVATLSFLIVGCATSKITYTPEGEVGHSINCSGTAIPWGACYEKAGQLCGASGYTIISKDDTSGVMGGVDFFGGGQGMTKGIVIKCGK